MMFWISIRWSKSWDTTALRGAGSDMVMNASFDDALRIRGPVRHHTAGIIIWWRTTVPAWLGVAASATFQLYSYGGGLWFNCVPSASSLRCTIRARN